MTKKQRRKNLHSNASQPANEGTQKKTIGDKNHEEQQIKSNVQQKKISRSKSSVDKENNPAHKNNTTDNQVKDKETEPTVKTKMWIRPQSAQTSRTSANIKKRTDPVALYQEYQKDWERFRPNICESSRSDLRWQIRERMANRQT